MTTYGEISKEVVVGKRKEFGDSMTSLGGGCAKRKKKKKSQPSRSVNLYVRDSRKDYSSKTLPRSGEHRRERDNVRERNQESGSLSSLFERALHYTTIAR